MGLRQIKVTGNDEVDWRMKLRSGTVMEGYRNNVEEEIEGGMDETEVVMRGEGNDQEERINQVVRGMKDMNNKINRELKKLREEFGRGMKEWNKKVEAEGIRCEKKIEEVREAIGREMTDIRELVEEELSRLERRIVSREGELDSNGRRSTEKAEEKGDDQGLRDVDESREYLGLLFQEMDKCRQERE